MSVFDKGIHTLHVNENLHVKNRKRLIDALRNHDELKEILNSIILLEGGKSTTRNCSDHEPLFRQESFFHWTFGVIEPDFFGALHLATGKSYLFAPRLSNEYLIWLGKLKSLKNFTSIYKVDETIWLDELDQFLTDLKPDLILTLYGKNSDSGKYSKEAYFDGINKFKINRTILYREICELRVFKTDEELEVLRYANQISSQAHKEVMRRIRPGMKEYQLESIFQHYCQYYGGMRFLAYTCICGSGVNASILHYGHSSEPNNKDIEEGELCLLDMGSEYHCYASDVTCTLPCNGKFSDKQKVIYNAVLKANRTVLNSVKPGVCWVEMHLLAERIILNELKNAGLLIGDLDEMIKYRLGAIFMPHGLGHFIGVDTHDVGGYLEDCPERPKELGLRNLRTARKLQERMCITIEPGCYFIDYLLNKAYENENLSKFLVRKKIDEYKSVGGVRIEDDVVITKEGAELLTNVPRTIQEIEQFMQNERILDVVIPQEAVLKSLKDCK